MPPIPDSQLPNAPLVEILRKMYETADSNGWKKAQTYKKALENLRKVPHKLPLSDLTTVKSIGPKIAEELINGYRRWCEENGVEFPVDESWKKSSKKWTSAVEDVGSESDNPASNTTKKRKPKEYMPKRRSGAYALLLALYQSDIRFGEGKYVSKDDLIAVAQEHCDSSFTENARGTHYSAWGSMKTLKDKSLVHAKGRPEKFTLTDSGVEVAAKIYRAEGLGGVGGGRVLRGREKSPEDEDEEVEDLMPKQPIVQTRSDICKNPYLSPAANRMAAARDRQKDNEEEWPDFTTTTQPKPRSTLFRTSPEPAPAPSRRTENASSATSKPTSTKPMEICLLSDSEDDAVAPLRSMPVNRPAKTSSVARNHTQIPHAQPPSRSNSRAPSAGPEEPLPEFVPTTFPPGSFDIHLILDNREKSSRANPDYMQQTLSRKHDIQAFTRGLAVGDVQWIAKHKATGQEVMLDFIVERKRLDDLVESIKDGRYREQKSRLRKSGMSKVVYIIEEYVVAGQSERSLGINPTSMEAVDTAIASTQIVEGFFVKRTKKVDDTLRYLAGVTQHLKKQYLNKTLYIIPSRHLDIKTYPRLRAHLKTTEPTKSYHIEFSIFQDMLDKTAETDLRDVFIRMLMCIKGVTAQKAVQIQYHFGTPAGLAQAYEDCHSKEDKETLIMRECTGIGKKATTRAVSAKVAEMWG